MSEAEETDQLPVLARDVELAARAGRRSAEADVRRPRATSLPAVQAAAAAAGGFVAGAAVLGLVQRRNRAGAALAKGSRRRGLSRRSGANAAVSAAAETLQIVSSHSLLVDVHVLGTPRTDG